MEACGSHPGSYRLSTAILVALKSNIRWLSNLRIFSNVFEELGADYCAERHQDRARLRAVKELERLGFDVQISPAA